MKRKTDRLPDEIIKAIYVENIGLITDWQDPTNIDYTDSDGRTMLFQAILAGSENIVLILLQNGATVNLKDHKGWYPLHYAAQNYRAKIANLLLKKGADIEAKDDYGNTPLWRSVFASQGRGEMISLLLSHGANPNNANDSGVSPLALARNIANHDVKQFFE